MADRLVELHVGRYVHPIYREQLHAVPDGWSYTGSHPALHDSSVPTKRVVDQGARFARTRALAERLALRVLSESGYVHRVRASPQSGTALIHSAELLLRNAPLPYVLDFEHAELFVLYQSAALRRPWARARLERSLQDERLRFLLAWSDAARRSMLAVLRADAVSAIEPKIRVVLPAIRLATDRPRVRDRGPLRVLFVGTSFYEKGAVEAIEALRLVRASHDVTLDLVSYTPPEWQARLVDEPGLTLHQPGGADLVQRLYSGSDVLLFPSHMDTFGYVVMEAMSHGLPVLAPDAMASPELLDHGRSGLLFPPEGSMFGEDTLIRFRHVLPPPRAYLESLRRPSTSYVRGIADALARMADESGLHSQLAEGAFLSVRDGVLSIARRRRELAEIYAAAIR